MTDQKSPDNLSELIHWVKEELLSEQAQRGDPVPLFVVDEITVEVNFVVDTSVRGGVSILKVVEAGTEIAQEKVHKAVVKMKPILNRDEMIAELVASNPDILNSVKSDSTRALMKGRFIDDPGRG